MKQRNEDNVFLVWADSEAVLMFKGVFATEEAAETYIISEYGNDDRELIKDPDSTHYTYDGWLYLWITEEAVKK